MKLLRNRTHILQTLLTNPRFRKTSLRPHRLLRQRLYRLQMLPRVNIPHRTLHTQKLRTPLRTLHSRHIIPPQFLLYRVLLVVEVVGPGSSDWFDDGGGDGEFVINEL